jgi:uncharacterized phage infection (PIP) family protein YhgE
VKVSGEVVSVLKEIGNGVEQVTGLIKEVTNASAEQSRGISQVATAVTQMDQVTQSNAASIEELSSQAQELNSLVEQMLAILGRSQVGQGPKALVGAGVPRITQGLPPAVGLETKALGEGARSPVITVAGPNRDQARAAIPLDEEDFTDF